MKKTIAMLQIGCAVLLYVLSAVAFIDYMYSLTIRDTVTAVENAFGTLVILVAMLVLAKFTLAAGRKKLREETQSREKQAQAVDDRTPEDSGRQAGQESPVDAGQDRAEKGAEN